MFQHLKHKYIKTMSYYYQPIMLKIIGYKSSNYDIDNTCHNSYIWVSILIKAIKKR